MNRCILYKNDSSLNATSFEPNAQRCIQHGLSNKCVCNNCNNKMSMNNLSKYNQNVPEVNFNHYITESSIQPFINRLEKLENKQYQTDYNYKKSFYEPPAYYDYGQEFNYPYKHRNQTNMWFHNEGGDFGGHSLYENPFVGPRNTYINQYAHGPNVPYYSKKSHSNPNF